ncbi:MAG: mannose-1-phosphate guanylyltransferase, partial [Acidobacteriota bacterium]|jgi:mannose-1-phosphate guanylyltransferase
VALAGGDGVRRVIRFVEKPSVAVAEAMLAEGGYLWNAGMFVWSVDAIVDAIRAHLPELAGRLDEMTEMARTRGEEAAIAAFYPRLPRVSIDHGVMEKASRVWAVPVEFAWSDVGSWEGLAEAVGGIDGVRLGDVLGIDSDGAVLVSDGPLVAALGVPGVVVVATGDAVLVLPRTASQRVKEIVEELRRRGRHELL